MICTLRCFTYAACQGANEGCNTFSGKNPSPSPGLHVSMQCCLVGFPCSSISELCDSTQRLCRVKLMHTFDSLTSASSQRVQALRQLAPSTFFSLEMVTDLHLLPSQTLWSLCPCSCICNQVGVHVCHYLDVFLHSILLTGWCGGLCLLPVLARYSLRVSQTNS